MRTKVKSTQTSSSVVVQEVEAQEAEGDLDSAVHLVEGEEAAVSRFVSVRQVVEEEVPRVASAVLSMVRVQSVLSRIRMNGLMWSALPDP